MKPKVYIYISTYKYTYIYILCIIYILYVYLCVCVCMCVYVICRPIAIVSTDIFLQKLLYTFLLQKPPTPLHPSFLSMGSIRHLVFFTSLTTRENERIIGQGTRVRSHMAPRFFRTFHPILPLSLEKKIARKLPIEERSRPWENLPLFFFFFYFDPREKKKKRMHERDFSILSIGNRTKENSKAISNVSGEKVRSVGRAVTDFICSTLDGYESCTGIQVSIVYTSLTPRTRNRPPRYYNPDILSRYSVASMFVSKTRYVDYI